MPGRSRASLLVAFALLVGTVSMVAPTGATASTDGTSPAEYWTAERMADAIPRDLVVDHRGLGYLRLASGDLRPYGHDQPAEAPRLRATPIPGAKPDGDGSGGGNGGAGGNTDTTGPTVTMLTPSAAEVIGASHTFEASVADDLSGVKSVTFVITKNGGSDQSFNASHTGNDVWAVSLEGFTDGTWSWYVVAKDGAKKGGNTTTSNPIAFEVSTGTSGGDDGGGGTTDCSTAVANAEWTCDGAVQTAAGRLYFEMPSFGPFWGGYVCSGTVAFDSSAARSYVITAAHCVYDDQNKVFARNVLFIPDQAGTNGTGTDTNCSNDPIGCWAPSHGVVDDSWASRTWPDNIPWDYGYYVVPDSGAYSAGITTTSAVLDAAAGSIEVQFTEPTQELLTHGLGYSHNEDPKFMYCADALGIDTNSHNSLWLANCGLSGGASGGPWMQSSTGAGPIVAVNSYGYSNQPGMGAAHLSNTAECVFTAAKLSGVNTAATCPASG